MTFINDRFAIRKSIHGGFTEVFEYVDGSPIFIMAFWGREQAITWINKQ